MVEVLEPPRAQQLDATRLAPDLFHGRVEAEAALVAQGTQDRFYVAARAALNRAPARLVAKPQQAVALEKTRERHRGDLREAPRPGGPDRRPERDEVPVPKARREVVR